MIIKQLRKLSGQTSFSFEFQMNLSCTTGKESPPTVTMPRRRSMVITHPFLANTAGRLSACLGFLGENDVFPPNGDRPPAAQPPSPDEPTVSACSTRNFLRFAMSTSSVASRRVVECARMYLNKADARIVYKLGLNLFGAFKHIIFTTNELFRKRSMHDYKIMVKFTCLLPHSW